MVKLCIYTFSSVGSTCGVIHSLQCRRSHSFQANFDSGVGMGRGKSCGGGGGRGEENGVGEGKGGERNQVRVT